MNLRNILQYYHNCAIIRLGFCFVSLYKSRRHDGDTSKVSSIVVTNGNTGEQITLTAEEPAYKDLLKLYWQLDFTAEYEENTRVGYQYSMKLLDAEGEKLQRVTPYEDGLTADGIFYQYDNTGDAYHEKNIYDYIFISYNVHFIVCV